MRCSHCNCEIDQTMTESRLNMYEVEICEECLEKCHQLFDMKIGAYDSQYFK